LPVAVEVVVAVVVEAVAAAVVVFTLLSEFHY